MRMLNNITKSTWFIFLLLTISVSTSNSSEIFVHECPCLGDDCVRKPTSDIWTSLTMDDKNATSTVTIRLKEKATGYESSKAPSEKIAINLLDPLNHHGQNGALQGTLQESGEPISLFIDEEGILSLYYGDSRGEQQTNAEGYCIRRLNTTYALLELCCDKTSCIRKCCPYGYIFSFDEAENPYCVESPKAGWNLPKLVGTPRGKPGQKIRSGFPNCQTLPYNITTFLSTSLTKFQIPRQPYRLYDDGTLKLLTGGGKPRWKAKPTSVDYCVDTFLIPEDKLDMTCGEDEQDVLILCNKPYVKTFSQKDWIYRIVYMIGFTISILFLVVTAVVHFLLWEKQNIHAWTILCYVLTLMGFYSCLLLIYVEETRKRWTDHYIPIISKEWCFALGIMTHFMGIFSFAWLSVINFDLWWTFRILKPMNQRGFDFKRLFCYGGFALAVPTVVVSIAGAFHFSFEKGSEPCRKTEEDPTVYPRYGEDSCFLANFSQPYYFYLPVGVLLLANLIFYMCTSCQMLRIYHATRQISNRNSRKQKQSCELFLKLFLVMGTTWIVQVILSVVEGDELSKHYSSIVVVLDLLNMLQPVAIFIIFVCKRETLRGLEQKYFCLKSCLHPFRGVYRTPTVISRSDGSTKMSRTELTKHSSIESTGSGDHRRDSELINFS